jgi:hypothetical protein
MCNSSQEIAKAYEFDCNVVPPFIDIHKQDHEDAWLVISNHMEIMEKLFVDEFVDTKRIRYLAEQLNYIFEEMSNINVKLSITYHHWVFTILDYYLQKAVKEECYEIASNLQKFTQLYQHEQI